jgi:hypothetical protein
MPRGPIVERIRRDHATNLEITIDALDRGWKTPGLGPGGQVRCGYISTASFHCPDVAGCNRSPPCGYNNPCWMAANPFLSGLTGPEQLRLLPVPVADGVCDMLAASSVRERNSSFMLRKRAWSVAARSFVASTSA